MNQSFQEEKPRLVPTGQGFSVLNTVEYKKRFLYSKYNPKRAIESFLDAAEIMPGTLVVACSPVLWYGADRLMSKTNGQSHIIAIEDDRKLYELAKKSNTSNIDLFSLEDIDALESHVNSLINRGLVKRIMKIDFSAGVQFSKEKYERIIDAMQQMTSQFWKNRITLLKMGRLFSKNIFRNLPALKNALQLDDMRKTISKTIIVFGAGESSDSMDFDFIRENRNSLYIIAVDAYINALMSRGITPDAAVGIESQSVILKAYVGTQNAGMTFFTDITSRPDIARMFSKTVFLSTKFSDASFLDGLKESGIVSSYVKPMGSVGLTAVHVALELRASEKIPVYITGLDFSYSVGKTHARSTFPHKTRLSSATRLASIENLDASYAPSSTFMPAINGESACTTKILLSYASQFIQFFSMKKNLFDARKHGIDLSLKHSDRILLHGENKDKVAFPQNRAKNVTEYLEKEKKELEKIKSLLANGENSPERNRDFSLKEELQNLLSKKEYLYLHFPDGYMLRIEEDFLKRVRAEIDVFLKYL